MCHVICEQQRRRSACASAQTEQHLCCLLLRKYNISRFYSRNFKTLASFCGCASQFVSGLVGNSQRHVLSCRSSYKRSTFFFFQNQSKVGQLSLGTRPFDMDFLTNDKYGPANHEKEKNMTEQKPHFSSL